MRQLELQTRYGNVNIDDAGWHDSGDLNFYGTPLDPDDGDLWIAFSAEQAVQIRDLLLVTHPVSTYPREVFTKAPGEDEPPKPAAVDAHHANPDVATVAAALGAAGLGGQLTHESQRGAFEALSRLAERQK